MLTPFDFFRFSVNAVDKVKTEYRVVLSDKTVIDVNDKLIPWSKFKKTAMQ